MWIPRKKWEVLEKRVADLEGKVQGQLETEITPEMILQSLQGMDLKVSLCDPGVQKRAIEGKEERNVEQEGS